MATLVATTVDTGGTEDYPTLYAAEQANFGQTGGNFVTADTYAVCSCICTNGAADTTAVMVSGQTTDSTHNITVTVPTAYRHNGTFPASGNKYRLVVNGGISLQWYSSNVTLSEVSIGNGATTANDYTVQLNGTVTGAVIQDCLLWQTPTGAQTYPECLDLFGNISLLVSNCILYGAKTSHATNKGYCVWASCGTGTTRFSNVVFVGCDYGIVRDSGTVVLKNCISFGNPNGDYTGTFSALSTNNGYSNGTGPSGGSAAVNLGTDPAAIFVDYANNDFRLVPGCAACSVGAQLYDDATLPVTTDIVGAARPKRGIALPDIGAFQITAIPSPSGLGGGGAMVDLRFSRQRPAPYWSSRRRRR